MAIPKAKTGHKRITTTLTAEEYDILETFAAEQSIEDIERAVPAVLHELVRLHDQLWDAQFAQPNLALDALAQKALDDDHAGLTEDLDI
jgi:hypothetical protein